jgi:pyridoxal 5'-phosphate synthase pdxS subunit
MREVQDGIRRLRMLPEDELMAEAKNLGAPYHVLVETAELGKLPVPNFAAGGIATPTDAALMMQLGAETVFVGSGIFASEDPAPRAKAIVEAVTYFDDPKKLMEISMELGEAMKGRAVNEMDDSEKMAGRGW